MANFDSLKRTVYNSLTKENFEDDSEQVRLEKRIITGALVLYSLESLINHNSRLKADIKTLSDEYIKTYHGIVNSLKDKYISYKRISEYVNTMKIRNFINIKKVQVESIQEFYKMKDRIEPFSFSRYSQRMYNYFGLSSYENQLLNTIHKNIICPIIKHYRDMNGISVNDIFLELDTTAKLPKGIILSINGIKPNKIISDIEKDIFNVKSYFASADIITNNSVRLLIN